MSTNLFDIKKPFDLRLEHHYHPLRNLTSKEFVDVNKIWHEKKVAIQLSITNVLKKDYTYIF